MATTILGNINIDPLLRAQIFLDQAIQLAHSELENAGAIQGFEICYELAWKTMKRIPTHRGIEANSPREIFRSAAQETIIANLDSWFDCIKK